MNRLRSRVAGLCSVVAVGAALAGCTRVIEWDEEVPLNTGETIWVQRSGTYSVQSQPGNPFVYRYWPDRTTRIAFTYRGRQYAYTTDADLQVLAIAADGTPNLVISAADHPWQWKHGYYCTRPSYVQLRPDASGENWTWPQDIDAWLYGLPTNLLMGVPAHGAERSRMTNEAKAKRNVHVFMSGEHFEKVDPAYQTSWCRGAVTAGRKQG